eukprot:2860771-Heterocapsa_arctica.AAC.1
MATRPTTYSRATRGARRGARTIRTMVWRVHRRARARRKSSAPARGRGATNRGARLLVSPDRRTGRHTINS